MPDGDHIAVKVQGPGESKANVVEIPKRNAENVIWNLGLLADWALAGTILEGKPWHTPEECRAGRITHWVPQRHVYKDALRLREFIDTMMPLRRGGEDHMIDTTRGPVKITSDAVEIAAGRLLTLAAKAPIEVKLDDAIELINALRGNQTQPGSLTR
jgi:hypothetical protein